jgi:predicted RNA-binding Zn-ribbon protein involved in translation (DUF1610 family)
LCNARDFSGIYESSCIAPWDVVKYLKVCPQCGSAEVMLWLGPDTSLGYICKSCGFRALVFPEMTGAARKKYLGERRRG